MTTGARRRAAFAALLSMAGLWAAGASPATATVRAASAPSPQDRSLARIVDRYSAELGIRRRSLGEISAADLPPSVVGSLSRELRQLYRCDVITRSHTNQVLAALPGR